MSGSCEELRISTLRPQRHEPPAGWPPDAFERLTDAIAAALVARYRQREAQERPLATKARR
jgi:hypothetical protein